MIKMLINRWKRLFRKLFNKKSVKPQKQEDAGDEVDLNDLSGKWSLSELLDNLPKYRKVLGDAKPYLTKNFDHLMRLGPTIISPDSWWATNDKFIQSKNRPSMFFVGVCIDSAFSKDDNIVPCFYAAIKQTPPINVERLPGDCYQFICLFNTQHGKYKINDWAGGWVYFDGTNIRIARERYKDSVSLPRQYGKGARRVPVIRYESRIEKFYDDSAEMEGLDKDRYSGKETVSLMFRAGLNYWNERDKNWLVITKKDGNRVSFAVRPGQQVYFFKDRDKIVTTPTGQRKKIFHLVTEHTRKVRKGLTTVKEHCRGQRHFFWHNTECHIFSPGWHGSDLFKLLDVTALSEDDIDEDIETLEMHQVTEKIARIIEGTATRQRRARHERTVFRTG